MLTKTAINSITDMEQQHIDMLRAALHSNVSLKLIRDLLTDEHLPVGVNRNVIRQTIEHLERFNREIKNNCLPTRTFLSHNPKGHKVYDMATICELMMRIGCEEDTSVYDEFLGLIVDCIDTVYYSQQHRRKIYFGKFKAMFQLITAEMRANVNGEIGQMQYIQGELFLRTTPPIHEPQIKTND